MRKREKDIMNLLSKKYTYKMLKSLDSSPKRFKDLADVCKGEKMRTERLKEFEQFSLIKVRPKRIGRRSVSIYELSDTGKNILKMAENIRKLYSKK